jgi:acyl carrier protein
MQAAEIYEGLNEIFRDVFMREIALRADLSARDVEDWDSYKQIEIIIAAEQHFGIKLSTRDIDSLRNVGDLVGVVTARLAAK